MTGLHDSLRYVVVIVMNAALYFCPNEHVFKRLSSLVGYNWWIFKCFLAKADFVLSSRFASRYF